MHRNLAGETRVAEAVGGSVVPVRRRGGASLEPYAAGGAQAPSAAVQRRGQGGVRREVVTEQHVPEVCAVFDLQVVPLVAVVDPHGMVRCAIRRGFSS